MYADHPCTLRSHDAREDEPLSYPDIVLTENALCDCLADATAGVVITYHVGLLTVDRDPKLSKLPPERRDELVAIADRAMRLSDAGWVHLLQRRVAVECFAYLLVVRPGPRRVRSASAPDLRAFFLAEAA